jgi:hypothetical protein
MYRCPRPQGPVGVGREKVEEAGSSINLLHAYSRHHDAGSGDVVCACRTAQRGRATTGSQWGARAWGGGARRRGRRQGRARGASRARAQRRLQRQACRREGAQQPCWCRWPWAGSKQRAFSGRAAPGARACEPMRAMRVPMRAMQLQPPSACSMAIEMCIGNVALTKPGLLRADTHTPACACSPVAVAQVPWMPAF